MKIDRLLYAVRMRLPVVAGELEELYGVLAENNSALEKIITDLQKNVRISQNRIEALEAKVKRLYAEDGE